MSTKTTKQKENSLGESLQQLRTIADWFESQEEIDIEEGLAKVKEASVLIKESRERLQKLENEFIEVKKKMSDETL